MRAEFPIQVPDLKAVRFAESPCQGNVGRIPQQHRTAAGVPAFRPAADRGGVPRADFFRIERFSAAFRLSER